MTRNQTVATGAMVAGAAIYLYFANKKGWWPFRPPNVPSQPNVQVRVIDQNTAELDVSWQAIPGASYYQIFVNSQIAADNITGNSAVVRVQPGKTYNVQVAACRQ
ncbi:MAG: hypothetical protein ACP5LD_10590 [Desulfomonilaceae bacterium]